MQEIIVLHLERIKSNILYAIAQDNNHGVSESVALYIGGSWLSENFSHLKYKGDNYKRTGLKWLEERTDNLIDNNGSFSQHSTNYHRVLIDLLTITEFWRKLYGLKLFSNNFYSKVDKAISWMEQMYDEDSGKVPNLGANDGSRILNLHSLEYDNYKATIQTSRNIFSAYRRFKKGIWDEASYNLRIKDDLPVKAIQKKSSILDNSYGILNGNSRTWGLIRLPRFTFRPKHNDVFHFDLWYKGNNIFCDSGSFSYWDKGGEKFKSIRSHNSVSFGGKEQMGKISKFLLKNWINSDQNRLYNNSEFHGKYIDSRKNTHKRIVIYKKNIWKIIDTIDSSENLNYLYWNIPFDSKNCTIRRNSIETNLFKAEFEGHFKLTTSTSKYSPFYNSFHEGLRIELAFNNRDKITSTVTLKN